MKKTLSLALVSAGALLPSFLQAASATWSNTGSDFNNAANWGGVVSGTSVQMFFASPATGAPIADVSAPISVSSLGFTAATSSGYTISGSNGSILTLATTSTGTNSAIYAANTSGVNTITVGLNLGASAGTQTITTTNGGSLVISGPITSATTVVLNLAGTGAVTLSNSNSFTGPLSISSGLLNIGNDDAVGSGTFSIRGGTTAALDGPRTLNNAVYLSAGATIAGTQNLTFAGVFTQSQSSRTLTINNSGLTTFSGPMYLSDTGLAYTLTIAGTGNTMLSGNISNYNGAGGAGCTLAISNTGTTTISGSNSFSGGFIVNNGAFLNLNNDNAAGTGGIAVKGGTIVAGDAAHMLNNAVSMQGSFAIGGTNNLTFAGVWTFTGGNRTLTINNAGLTTVSGNVYLNDSATIGRQQTIAGTGNVLISGNIADYSGGNVAVPLIITNTGKTTFSGTNTYTGPTTVNAGTAQFTKRVSLYNGVTSNWKATSIIVGNGATLALNVGGTTQGEFTAADVEALLAMSSSATTGFKAGSTLGLDTTNADDGEFVYSSGIANPSYTGSGLGISKLGSNRLTLSGSNTYTGATTVNAGELRVDGSIASASAVTVKAGATLSGSGVIGGTVGVTSGTVNGTGLSMGSTTFNGTSFLAGTTLISNLTIATGTTTLTGTTAVSGSLAVSNGSVFTNSGTVTGNVSVSGVMNGTGTVDGALQIKAGGELAPGNSPGTQTVTGNFTVDSGARVSMQLDSLASYDQIVVGGVITLDGTLDLSLGAMAGGQLYTLILNSGTSAIQGAFANIEVSGSAVTLGAGNTFTVDGLTYDLSYTGGDGNDLTLSVLSVPEPSTWVMIVGGVGMLAVGQRMRRRAQS